jgi:hypothetical protein
VLDTLAFGSSGPMRLTELARTDHPIEQFKIEIRH